ncbi:MAG TPA: AsmA family protein [Rhodanobacter sp.]|nr:AsmA family protein [Rhodanobacter sp.]
MKRNAKIASWVTGALAALLVVALVVIATFNWNHAKPWLSDRLSQAIGRPFAINGDLTVDWHRNSSSGWLGALVPWPRFTARDVSIANPAWARQPQFARLAALHFDLSPLPLLAHRISVPSVQLVQPAVDLQRDQDGRATWTFTPASSGTPSAWTLEVGSIGLDRGHITFADALTQTQLDIVVTPLQRAIPYDQIVAQQSSDAHAQVQKRMGTAAAKALAAGGQDKDGVGDVAAATTYQFDWTAKGSFKGAPASGHGKTGSVLALQVTDRPFPVQADIRLGDSHIAFVGTLTDPLHLGALDVRLWFSGSSMSKLYEFTGITLPDTRPYATAGRLQATLGDVSHYSYRNFRGRVGGSDLAGSLEFVSADQHDRHSRAKLSGTVNSKVLQFTDLAPLIGADSNAAKRQRGDAVVQPADKVLPVAEFRTGRWRAMDAKVKFSAARIVYKEPLPVEALSTQLTLQAGTLTLDPLVVSLAGGTAKGNLRLDGSKTPMQGALKLNARHLKLKQLFPTFESMQASFGEVNGDTTLHAAGNSVAALLGSSNGDFKLLMNDGAISKTLLETAGLNVGNIVLAKLFGDKTVKINCAATDLTAKDGVFDVRLFVFDTGDALINMDGTVNLATEQLDLEIQPHTRGLRILSLRSPLYVKGTLKNPDVGVQKGPLLLRGGGAAALAVVAAPAAALLALIAPSHDREDADNACHAVLDRLRTTPASAAQGRQAATPRH